MDPLITESCLPRSQPQGTSSVQWASFVPSVLRHHGKKQNSKRDIVLNGRILNVHHQKIKNHHKLETIYNFLN